MSSMPPHGGGRLGGMKMSSLDDDVERVTTWLAATRFCAGLDAGAVSAIANALDVRRFTAGDTLASAGDTVDEFWVVAEGELDSFLTDERGRERWLAVVHQGETVGELAILEN